MKTFELDLEWLHTTTSCSCRGCIATMHENRIESFYSKAFMNRCTFSHVIGSYLLRDRITAVDDVSVFKTISKCIAALSYACVSRFYLNSNLETNVNLNSKYQFVYHQVLGVLK